MLTILTHPDPRLREVAKPIDAFETEEIRALIEGMREALLAEGGIGLAATQVGAPKRLLLWCTDARADGIVIPILNPEFTLREGSQVTVEGCLSVPGIQGQVERYRHVQVRGKTPSGRTISYRASNYEAACLQHEVDHLDGLCFVDLPKGPRGIYLGIRANRV